MRAKQTFIAAAVAAFTISPAAALAIDGAEGPPVAPRAGKPSRLRIEALERPVDHLREAIEVQLERIRAQRRARQRALRRRRQEAFATLPGGVSQATLDAIAACESGGNPTAVSADGAYRGKYQFDYGTWASVGGSGDPAAASEAEQDYRAALLYARAGSSPWPVCG